jgi:hypothetical protein
LRPVSERGDRDSEHEGDEDAAGQGKGESERIGEVTRVKPITQPNAPTQVPSRAPGDSRRRGGSIALTVTLTARGPERRLFPCDVREPLDSAMTSMPIHV